jgi:hypothetical protein
MSDTASAVVAWTQNLESDLAGYRVHWGTASGVYSTVIDVGLTATPSSPSYLIGPLAVTQTIYASITAYDTSNNESALSLEVSKFIPGSPLVATGQLVGLQLRVVRGTMCKPAAVVRGS